VKVDNIEATATQRAGGTALLWLWLEDTCAGFRLDYLIKAEHKWLTI
jgi:hypothetical protein